MEQRPTGRTPSANANFVIAALLAVPGLINLVQGLTGNGTGRLICGIAALAYGLLLARDGFSIKKTGRPSMPQSRMLLLCFVCLSIYMVGLYLKHAG